MMYTFGGWMSADYFVYRKTMQYKTKVILQWVEHKHPQDASFHTFRTFSVKIHR